MEKKIKEFDINIKKLNSTLEKTNSFFYVFLRGVSWGVGSVIGATVIAVIVIAILSNIIQSINDVPILNNIINNYNK